MIGIWRKFWAWYGRHYLLTLVVTSGLFLLQGFHLYWLFTDIILKKLTGISYFHFPQSGLAVYVFIDYFEIPTHLSLALIYIYQLRKKFKFSDLTFFIFLQIHWIHIFWLTDEIVLKSLNIQGLPIWNTTLAWFAILIDYLELPVIFDQLSKIYTERRIILAKIKASFPNS